MATYWVRPGAAGTNAGTQANPFNANPGAFTAAVNAATADGDVILVHYTSQEELAVDTTYTFAAANVQVYSVDMDSSDAITEMGTGGWIGHSTTNRGITIAGGRKVLVHGITLRVAGSTADSINLVGGDNSSVVYKKCYLWQGNTATGATISSTANDSQSNVTLDECTLRFGNTAQVLVASGRLKIIGGSISSAGSAITTIFSGGVVADSTGTFIEAIGFDMSGASSTATILGDCNVTPATLTLRQCKLPASATYLATQTAKNNSSGEIYCIDCSAGATQNFYLYQNQLGVLQTNTAITYTGETQSWKIDTTADCTPFTPFISPWVGLWNTSTSSLTPRFEILRDGSTTAYNNDEVWAEFSAKVTASSTLGTQYTDRMAYLGTPAAQATGAGLGSWAGESGTAWSGKIDSGSALTPAETGPIMGRVLVGLASATVYVSPTPKV